MVIINLGGDNLLQPFPQVMVIALMSGFEGKGFASLNTIGIENGSLTIDELSFLLQRFKSHSIAPLFLVNIFSIVDTII